MCRAIVESAAHTALNSTQLLPHTDASGTFDSVEWELEEDHFMSSSSDEMRPLGDAPHPLDEECFPGFAPLIHACQAYANLSGCRFSIRAFDGIECASLADTPRVNESRSQDAAPLLSAKLQAASVVYRFAGQLKDDEPDLLQDLQRAFDVVIKESVRNSMIAACKAADFFPPPPTTTDVDEEDCSWDEHGLASAPVIAQRLYNDAVQRLHDRTDAMNVRAKTASFVAEFADEVGVQLPEVCQERTDILREFQKDLQAWIAASSQTSQEEPGERAESPATFLQDAGAAFLNDAADLQCKLLCEADKWIGEQVGGLDAPKSLVAQHRDSLLWGTAALAVAGAVGATVRRIARSSTHANTSDPHHMYV
jgi:hypothetical protein